MSGKQKTEGVRRIWDKYKFVALVALAGAVLLLWPGGDGKTAERASPQAAALVEAELQQEMEDILGRIQGVGEVQVLLTVESDGERQLAQDSELSYSGSTAAPEDYSRSSQTVLVDDGSAEAPVVTRTVYPTYRGALVVCQGGDRADVKLAVTEAVAALTGLSADRTPWQNRSDDLEEETAHEREMEAEYRGGHDGAAGVRSSGPELEVHRRAGGGRRGGDRHQDPGGSHAGQRSGGRRRGRDG